MQDEPARSRDVIDSWKGIAAYLGRDMRTVMRWEETRSLPVRRLPGGSKAAVYALKSELERWRQGRNLRLIDPREESEDDGHPAAGPRSRRIGILWASAATVVLVAVAAGVAWRLNRKPVGGSPFQMIRLTYEPRVGGWPAISADGKFFAFASDREGSLDIYAQQMGGRQAIRVTHHEADDMQPSLSPDGLRIAFRSDRDGGGIYLVETLGGIERKIADRGEFPSFSPDGSTIAYVVRNAFTRRATMSLVRPAADPHELSSPNSSCSPSCSATRVQSGPQMASTSCSTGFARVMRTPAGCGRRRWRAASARGLTGCRRFVAGHPGLLRHGR